MNSLLLRQIPPEKDLTELKILSEAVYKMIKYLMESPNRRMILVSLSKGEKTRSDIVDDVKKMGSCIPKGIDRAFRSLIMNGFITEKDGKIALADKGRRIAEIFPIALDLYKTKGNSV